MKKECTWTGILAIPITVSILLMFSTQLCFSQSFRILVLQKERSFPDFGPYLGEILRAEGIVDFELKRFSEISLEQLSNYKLLIMSPGRWENGTLVAVRKYVEAGGNLIVFLPEKETASFLRLKVTKSKSSEGYIHFNGNDKIAEGLSSESVQIHGPSWHYDSADSYPLAWFGANPKEKVFQAVSLCRLGSGKLVSFAYDLPWSIALTRQGNPIWANQENDGVPGLRPNDMFLNGKDSWIDPDKVLIPQADEQMHFFARIVAFFLPPETLPRLWCFPNAADGAVIMTSDHEFGTKEAVEAVRLDMLRLRVPLTLFLTRPFGEEAAPSLRQFKELWEPNQLSLGAHFESGSDWLFPTADQMKSVIERDTAEFQKAYHAPVETTRMHNLRWIGWTFQARVLADAGVGMDFTYVNFIPAYDGYMTGSGLPLRFVDQQGRIFDIFQQLTQYEDDVVISQMDYSSAWSIDEAVANFARILRQSITHYHTAICLNFHPPFYGGNLPDSENSNKEWIHRCIAVAKEMGVPILSSNQWHRFVRSKDHVRTSNFKMKPNGYEFTLEAPHGVDGLTVLFPFQQMVPRLKIDQKLIETSLKRIRGRSYSAVTRDFKGASYISVEF